MQIALIVLIAVVAIGAVLWPLVRTPGGAGAGDLDPLPDRRDDVGLEGPSPADLRAPAPPPATAPAPPPGTAPAPPPGTASAPGTAPPPGTVPAPGAPRVPAPGGSPGSAPAPAPVPGETGSEELPQAAPPPAEPPRPLGARGAAPAGSPRTAGPAGTPTSPIEAEILDYREALRAHTVCRFCSTASPPGSKYCKECGEKLA